MTDCQIGIADAGFADQNPRLDMPAITGFRHRWLLVAASLIAAAGFALSVQGGRWWSISDVTLGPLGARSPFGGIGGFAWAGGSAQWERFGIATYAAGLVAMLVLIFIAGALAARRMPRLAAKTAIVAVGVAALVGSQFATGLPHNGLPFELDRGFWLFAGAVIVGAFAAAGVLRQARRAT
ncbi:MAG TPA: hypothetical protein VHW23_27155 [Kofleriaceae bacterium]|nr:hypothetical protein [Kofleriaceae bacterium]